MAQTKGFDLITAELTFFGGRVALVGQFVREVNNIALNLDRAENGPERQDAVSQKYRRPALLGLGELHGELRIGMDALF
ncbi:hypothetical protein WL14_04890 [Burkholderia cepacia]|nr:hypothetical protein WL14_04890 [Burkholderia cepacia]